jgi:DNA-binding FadR family transcriptional regulator
MKSAIKSVDNSSLVDKVEKNLVSFFIENKFQPGDQVPKEIELSLALKVSRTVLR